jgi:CHAD domain-containing protein
MTSRPEIRWDASKSVAENARQTLPELARQFFAAGRAAATLDSSPKALHHFRLQTKRFRYIIELFGDYYGPALERRIEALRTLQDLLGAINDCSATQDLLLNRDDLHASQRDRLLRTLKATAARRVAAFRRHWLKEFSSPAVEQGWTDYLGRFARRTG